MRTGRGLLYCIYWSFEVLPERKVSATYSLGRCNWSFFLSIEAIAKCLAISGPKRQSRASKSASTRSGRLLPLKWYLSSSCYQKQTMGILSSYSRFYLISYQSSIKKAHSMVFSFFSIPHILLGALPLNYWHLFSMFVCVRNLKAIGWKRGYIMWYADKSILTYFFEFINTTLQGVNGTWSSVSKLMS